MFFIGADLAIVRPAFSRMYEQYNEFKFASFFTEGNND